MREYQSKNMMGLLGHCIFNICF